MKILTMLFLMFLITAEVFMNSSHAGEDKIKIYNAGKNTVEEVDKIERTDEQWKKLLTPEQYNVLRGKGTERPFSGACELPKQEGIYECAACGTDLFLVRNKFESGTGWPSFWEPVSKLNILEKEDRSYGMTRTEVLCARCGSHLGHVFDDGPPPTGKRYCINSVALNFVPDAAKKTEKATFAAGCFWGVEEAFRTVKGVISTKVGYTGGTLDDPTYKDVCTDKTGHAEAVEIEYDPSIVKYGDLLNIFWSIHNPTTMNRQGPDFGTQYRSVIFYHDDSQKKAAIKSKADLEKSGRYQNPIVTEIVPAGKFYDAEEYHQKYLMKRGEKSCGLQ